MSIGLVWLLGCRGPYDVDDERVYVDLAMDGSGVCAVADDRGLHCWGYTAKNAPGDVVSADLDMSASQGCLLSDDGTLTCWDALSTGGDQDGEAFAARVVAEGVDRMAVGADAVCWDGAEGAAACSPFRDQTYVALPDRGDGGESAVATFAVGTYFACASYLDGVGACASSSTSPALPEAIATIFDASDLAFADAGGYSACVIDQLGRLACAGAMANCDQDEMGNGPCIEDWSPGGSWRDVATDDSTCAVGADGTITCHGDTCGAPEGSDFVRVVLASPSVCGLRADGSLACVVDVAAGTGDGEFDCQPGHPSALQAAVCDNLDFVYEGGPC